MMQVRGYLQAHLLCLLSHISYDGPALHTPCLVVRQRLPSRGVERCELLI